MTQNPKPVIDPSAEVENLVCNLHGMLDFFQGTTLDAEARPLARKQYLIDHLENCDDALDQLDKLTKALNRYRALLRDEQATRGL